MRPDRARTQGGAVAVRLFWFIAVGGVATLVHVATVSLLVRWGGWPPVLANVAGWFVAFGCSFAGHRQGTFAARAVDPAVAGRRFFIVSAAAFAANQLGYAMLIAFSPLRYDVAVAVTSLVVALGTYVLSSRWAFRSAGDAAGPTR